MIPHIPITSVSILNWTYHHFKTTSVVAAGKVNTYYCILQESNATIHLYRDLQFVKAKVLSMKFQDENFTNDHMTTKPQNNVSMRYNN